MLPLARSLLYIFLSTVVISGSATLGWLYWEQLKHERTEDDRYQITAVVQTGAYPKQLSSNCLAEWMNLSKDEIKNLFLFNCQQAAESLVHTPHIMEAKVLRLPPNAVYVRYLARQPFARWGDWENTYVDQEGVAFPALPFYTPKKVPTIITGSDSMNWGVASSTKKMELALSLIELCKDLEWELEAVDVSKAFDVSWGRAEIVITLHHEEMIYLRLRPHEIKKQLEDFSLFIKNPLFAKEKKKPVVVDLRLLNVIIF